MLKTKIYIIKIYLDKILFKVEPFVNELKKNQIKIILNNEEFTGFHIDKNESTNYYEIVPDIIFKVEDNLTLQIIDVEYLSNVLKIYFAKNFNEDGIGTLDINIGSEYVGECVFLVKTVDEIETDIKSKPITFSNPISTEYSRIYTEHEEFKSEEIIEVNLEIKDMNENNPIDGLYEVELENY